MKLKECYIVQDIGDRQYMIGVEESPFKGMVKSNRTAALIVNILKDGADKEEIVNRILDEYDADRETVEKDVDEVIGKLNSIGALE